MNRAFTAMKLDSCGVIPARNACDRGRTRAELASAMMEMISLLECLELPSASKRPRLSGTAPGRNGHVDA